MQPRRIADPTIQVVSKEPEPKKTEPFFDSESQYTERESTIPVQEQSRKGNTAFLLAVGITVVGISMLLFGVWNSGSFYGTGSRMSGELATIFYTWQVGNLLQIAGAIITYLGVAGVINARRG